VTALYLLPRTQALWGRTSPESLQQVTQYEKLCEALNFSLEVGRAGPSDSPRLRYPRLAAGAQLLPLPCKEDAVNGVVAAGTTLPWSKAARPPCSAALPLPLGVAAVVLPVECQGEQVPMCTGYQRGCCCSGSVNEVT